MTIDFRSMPAIGAAFLLLCSCFNRGHRAAGAVDVDFPLKTVRLPDTPPFLGLSNLMFDSLPAGRLSVREEWRVIEFAPLMDAPGYRTVYAVRFRGSDSVSRIVVDEDADGDLTNDDALRFRHVGDVDIADVSVHLRPVIGLEQDRRLAMQVIVSAPYSYGRISEIRRGSAVVTTREIEVMLRPANRSAPLLGPSPNGLLFVDRDGDGLFREHGALDALGRVLPSEAVRIDRPFVIRGSAVEAVALSDAAGRLRLHSSAATTAPAAGFHAPTLTGSDLEGKARDLREFGGKVVLLSFWAIDCPWSEQVRPALDSLATSLGYSNFAWVAMARDQDRAALHAHLAKHPMRATILAQDSASWAEFNPSTITPLFYLIGRKGDVRMVETGASAAKMIATAIRRELDASALH